MGLAGMAETHNGPDAPLVLALDTAGSACAVALCRGPDTLARHRQAMRHGHATVVLPMILEVLQAAAKTFADIDRYVVNRGPGGFTGLRVGLAAMSGLALATDRPIIGIDGFDVLARQARALARVPTPVIAAIDSRRPEPYVQAYDAEGRRHDRPRCITPDALAGFVRQAAGAGMGVSVVGDAAPAVAAAVGSIAGSAAGSAAGRLNIDLPAVGALDPAELARLGMMTDPDRQPPSPLYIRPVDAQPAPPARNLAP